MNATADLVGWHRYWLCWFVVSFTAFLAPEIYGLATDSRRTLSAAIWHLEKYQPNQSIVNWSAFHFLFIASLIVIDIWLLGHFGWKVWH